MAKINNIYKRDFKNATHFAFIQAFIAELTACGFSAAKIVAKLQELVTAFARENTLFMQVRASEIVAQREEADRRRDSFYTRLHRLVQAWAGSGMATLDAAATALERPFNLYKVKTNAPIDEQTGQMENLITDISTPAMLANITAINGTYLYEQMVQAEELVKSLRSSEFSEVAEKELGALTSARKVCDGLYDEMVAIIEGASNFADDPAPYEAFIRKWNGAVKTYQDMLDRKSGSSTGGTANPDGTGEKPNTDNNNGGDTPSGGGTTEPENPTPDNPTPDNPTPDNPSGGETPGGGDNGGGPGPDENGGYNNE